MPARRAIGIDAGGTKLLGGVVDEHLDVEHRVRRVWLGEDERGVLDAFAAMAEEARALAPEVEAVGFGIPSLVDWASGASLSSVHLPLEGVPFRELMHERLGLPVYVDNDTNAAVLAEQRRGAARGASHVVMLTVGTGIGGGLILGGELYRGSGGAGAELGHVVVELDGPPCQGDCPGRGCLEAMASGTAIAREAIEAARSSPESALGEALAAGGRGIDASLVVALALAGDRAAGQVLELTGRRLGAGITSLVNIFNPEIVVIGGGVAAAGDLLLDPAREVLAERALRPSREQVQVVPAAFGPDAGMLGAALMALEGSQSEAKRSPR